MNVWPVRVVKVGGSLLEFDMLADRLAAWRKKEPLAHQVFIAGGGRLADAIRDADRRFALGEKVSHDLCLDVMSVTSGLLHAILQRDFAFHSPFPPFTLTRTVGEIQEAIAAASHAPIATVFDGSELMRWEAANGSLRALPCNWDVTSDSIAARIAIVLKARELVLLKSTGTAEKTRQGARDAGYVDAYFVQASEGVEIVRVVNLRSDDLEERTLSSIA